MQFHLHKTMLNQRSNNNAHTTRVYFVLLIVSVYTATTAYISLPAAEKHTQNRPQRAPARGRQTFSNNCFSPPRARVAPVYTTMNGAMNCIIAKKSLSISDAITRRQSPRAARTRTRYIKKKLSSLLSLYVPTYTLQKKTIQIAVPLTRNLVLPIGIIALSHFNFYVNFTLFPSIVRSSSRSTRYIYGV